MTYVLKFLFLVLLCFAPTDIFACSFSDIEHEFFLLSKRDPETYGIIFDKKSPLNNGVCNNISMVNHHGNKFTLSFNDEFGATRYISGRYEKLLEIPVLNKEIKKGEFISEDILSMKKLPKSVVNLQVILSVTDLIGKTAKKDLSAGIPLFRYEIEKVFVIKRNDQTDIVFRKGNDMELRIRGIALEDGSVGQKIKFKNTSSGKLIFAEIKNSNEAYIKQPQG